MKKAAAEMVERAYHNYKQICELYEYVNEVSPGSQKALEVQKRMQDALGEWTHLKNKFKDNNRIFDKDVRCVSCGAHGQLPTLDTVFWFIMRPENGWAIVYDGSDIEPICPDCITVCMRNI